MCRSTKKKLEEAFLSWEDKNIIESDLQYLLRMKTNREASYGFLNKTDIRRMMKREEKIARKSQNHSWSSVCEIRFFWLTPSQFLQYIFRCTIISWNRCQICMNGQNLQKETKLHRDVFAPVVFLFFYFSLFFYSKIFVVTP